MTSPMPLGPWTERSLQSLVEEACQYRQHMQGPDSCNVTTEGKTKILLRSSELVRLKVMTITVAALAQDQPSMNDAKHRELP